MSVQKPVLQTEGLRRSYNGRTVVHNFTATVNCSEIVVLVGPNGCGKTTSVEMALGLRHTEWGYSRLLGQDPVRDRRAIVSDLGIMLQNASLHARVRLSEQFQYLEALYGVPGAGTQLAHELGLGDVLNQQYGTLSGGQQRRALLITALINSPRLAVLDEPTSGIDLESRLKIWAVLRSLMTHQGTGILVTTHDLLEAEHQADRVIVMREGMIIASGTPQDLINATGLPFVVIIRATNVLKNKLSGLIIRDSGGETLVGFATKEEAQACVAECEDLGLPAIIRLATLEDAYLLLAASTNMTND